MMPSIVLTKDQSPTLFSEEYHAHYHSMHGAWQESHYVYIQNGLLHLNQNLSSINILEVGLGTGMNCFLTYTEFEKYLHPHISIEYYAVEKHPIYSSIVEQLSNYPPFINHPSLFFQIHQAHHDVLIHPQFKLHKIINDIQAVWKSIQDESIHLVYYDAFAPSSQPSMWQREIFEALHKKMISGGILVTFCAQGLFKRTLKQIGFIVENPPGAAGKREMTRAIKI